MSEVASVGLGFESEDTQTKYRKENHCGASVFQKQIW